MVRPRKCRGGLRNHIYYSGPLNRQESQLCSSDNRFAVSELHLGAYDIKQSRPYVENRTVLQGSYRGLCVRNSGHLGHQLAQELIHATLQLLVLKSKVGRLDADWCPCTSLP